MGLRDLVLMGTIYGTLPLAYLRPFYAVLMWYWLAIMNPHRLSWTLVHQPFAQLSALVMLTSMLVVTKERKELPITPLTVTLLLFCAWMLITTVFAIHPDWAWRQWDKVWKIMLTTFVSLLLLNTKYRLIALTTVATLSIALFGLKGGLFTVITGGNLRVWGPPGSFIGGNNEIGLALIMTVPLVLYLMNITPYRQVKWGLLVMVVTCVFAIVGTQSRGAFVGVVAMGLFMAMKTNNKAAYILLGAVLAVVAFMFMPESWHERINSIADYKQDGSAMGRIMAWRMAFNLALDRVFGGGFEAFSPVTYMMYLPEVGPRNTDAHSIYFEILGEHGFIGLGLFLAIGILSLRTCGKIIRGTHGRPEFDWMNRLAAMLQVSLVGYAVSGVFLGLAYFNYYYCLLAIVIGLKLVYDRDVACAEPKVLSSQPQQSAAAVRADSGPPLPPFPERLSIMTMVPLMKAWWHRL